MPSSNLPDPDKIPNMSLDEPDDKKPAPPSEPVFVSSPYKANEILITPETGQPAPPLTKPREWREGDDVLAPWEPFFLYPGVIKQIIVDEARGDQALISFDNGSEGWVFLYSLCPLEFKIGQMVEVRHPHGNRYAAAEIVEVEGEEVEIRYADGGADWSPIACIRIPCVENGPGAVGTKLAPWQGQPQTAPSAGSGIPSWMWTAGIVILLIFLRMGCAGR
jgi:hypothetical protein